MSRSVYYIAVGGRDITQRFTEFATDISITDSSGQAADTASISVADDNGTIALPAIGTPIQIGLGWNTPQVMFDGFIDDVDSSFSRGAGLMLSISAKSADTVKGKIKEQAEKHQDDAKLGDVFSKWAKEAGLTETAVHVSLANIAKDYWSMNSESFMAWGQRIARAYGATFKVMGSRAVLVPRSQGISASGRPLATIIAERPGNLIGGNIKPIIGRPQHAAFRGRHFDIEAGEWKSESTDATYDTEAEAIQTGRFTEPDQDSATKRSSSDEKETDRERGGGSVEIDGNPDAQAEATCIVRGVRPGVDGTYRVDSATHRRSRGGGYTTSLSLKQPKDGAGTDSR